MTRKRNDNKSTEFGLWLREQDQLDSRLGFVATNIDFMWANYKTGEWMLIEEKRHMASVKFPQSDLFHLLHATCKAGNSKYRGFHLVQFENTSPDDGRIWLDHNEITRPQLISFLRFEQR